MELLIDGARGRGLRKLTGNVLAVNASMRALAEAVGFAIHADPDDARHVIAIFDLTSA